LIRHRHYADYAADASAISAAEAPLAPLHDIDADTDAFLFASATFIATDAAAIIITPLFSFHCSPLLAIADNIQPLMIRH
jgi:hypothetical protein